MNQVVRRSEFGPWHPDIRGSFHYFVSGFRSLQHFEITVKPGLNVLLGTNGSGKTNYIDFLDFITSLVNRNIPSAISAAGGIARVFSQESLRQKIPRIRTKICGLADLEPFVLGENVRSKRYFNFEYELDLRYSRLHTAVYIANERIKFKNLHSVDNLLDHDKTVGSLEIYRKGPTSDDEVRWSVGTYLKSNAARNPLKHIHRHRITAKMMRERRNINTFRDELLAEPPVLGSEESILSARLVFPALDAIRASLSRSRSFNLNPSIAREPDDISKPPSIEPGGAGLYATIYQMQQTKNGVARAGLSRNRFATDALDTILSWTQIVIPDLEDITATADPHTGKYLVYLHVRSGGGQLKIPLQSTSDGTLKWLAYVCLVVAQGSEYTFEEPENYLHPKMQQFFVSLLRDNIEAGPTPALFIVSTHSETIINQCKPEELILFRFENGSTKCARVSNVLPLVRQVNETGFGLGHYYTNNVVR